MRAVLRSCTEIISYVLKKLERGQAITEFDKAIFPYMQLSNMTPQQYVDDLVTRFCQVSEVYEKETLNDVIIVGVQTSMRHCLRHY